jgi:hypothetical protein
VSATAVGAADAGSKFAVRDAWPDVFRVNVPTATAREASSVAAKACCARASSACVAVAPIAAFPRASAAALLPVRASTSTAFAS